MDENEYAQTVRLLTKVRDRLDPKSEDWLTLTSAIDSVKWIHGQYLASLPQY